MAEQINDSPLSSFPNLVKDLPAKATKIITRLLNCNRDNNWYTFAMEVWPKYSEIDIESRFEKREMTAVLKKWGSEGATTVQLFQVLNKIMRKDVILELQNKYPFVE